METVHVIINVFTAAAFFIAGCILIKKKRARYWLIGAAGGVAVLGYLLPSRPHFFTSLFPFADAIFYTNWYPFALALFIPAAFRFGKSRFQKIRIGILLAVFFVVTLIPYRYFRLPAAETMRATAIDEDGICRQTSLDTCGAAAIVTLLRLNGIETTEARAADLALTKQDRGTWILGQFRALKILTREHNPALKVCVRKLTADRLLSLPHPAIITVGLRGKPKTPDEKLLAERYSWTPSVMHDVVFLGIDETNPEKVKIGEPDFGLERWWIRELRILHQGYAIYLEQERKKYADYQG